MRLLIPQNMFSAIFAMTLNDEMKENLSVVPSSLISKKLENGEGDIGFIPFMDLITHDDFYLSSKIAISFDGRLSTSYLYFTPEQKEINHLYLSGDVSSNEIILTKVLFSEKYNTDINFTLDTDPVEIGRKNYLIAGNVNFENENFKTGISFSDQVAELIDRPFVNFVAASKDENKLNEFNKMFGPIDQKIEKNLTNYLGKIGFDTELTGFINENYNSVYYDLTENEIEGMNELIKLVFYRQIINEIKELKLV
ncbi:MAG: hypothetical protein K9J16_17575 [Melioribacteraceae bacterium]|nr:hypothetical protein [Melioribacteraceae bacterium]MCF8356690.1 hypothetical protein [Melioribacteraceae bacterium]MCF8393872.1 hypothetical protein [Melioribacteraceae bacterium]MCF8418245.1 hypothetical protein [Melioribacteraceae bacterium]